jgi:tetratricopeptide (TPR) repeat protein
VTIRRSRCSLAFVFSALVALLLADGGARAAPTPAPASPPPPPPSAGVEGEGARAAQLKDSGNQAMVDMRYVDALRAYEESLALAPRDVTLLYSISRAHQFLGEFPEALDALERFAREARPELKAKVGQLDDLFAQLRTRTATLDLKCNVDGVRVVVRSKVVGTTPLKGGLRLPSGAATLDFELEGFFAQHRDVVLPGGGVATVEVSMLPKSTSGVLVVTTEPTGAHILVDGRAEGTSSPRLELVLAAGAHKVTATRDGYDEALVPIVLSAGASRNVTVTLDKSVPLASRWWFWAGVGVVVAGGVVLTAALLTEKPAPHGSLAPGQASAPLLRF